MLTDGLIHTHLPTLYKLWPFSFPLPAPILLDVKRGSKCVSPLLHTLIHSRRQSEIQVNWWLWTVIHPALSHSQSQLVCLGWWVLKQPKSLVNESCGNFWWGWKSFCASNFGFGAEIVILRDNRLASITALCVLTAYLSTGAFQLQDVLHSPAL